MHIRDLARAHFADKVGASVGQTLAPMLIQRATAHLRVGLRHLEGEELVAIVESGAHMSAATVTDRVPFNGMLITDRRIIYGPPATSIPLHAISGVEDCSSSIRLVGPERAPLLRFVSPERVVPFLSAVVALPILSRVGDERPLVRIEPGDPTGVFGAIRETENAGADERVEDLLELICAAVERRSLPAQAAADLVARTILLHRNQLFARGTHEELWLSPLSAGDLGCALDGALGLTDGTVTDDRSHEPQWNRGSLAIRPLHVGTMSGFCTSPLESPLELWSFSQRIESLEAQLLLLRCLYGWNFPGAHLLRLHPPEIERRARAFGLPLDVAAFVRARGRTSRLNMGAEVPGWPGANEEDTACI